MRLFEERERETARRIGSLANTNPFLEERIGTERAILGRRFVPTAPVWSADTRLASRNPNLGVIMELGEGMACRARGRLFAGRGAPDGRDLEIYEALALYVLFYRYEEGFYQHIVDAAEGCARAPLPSFPAFAADAGFFFGTDRATFARDVEAAHLYALFFQLRRAFHFTFRHILGGSMASARLRAAVWQSIFTRDFGRYRRGLFGRMHDLSTLVTGPSGTGKDLVASAIGLSRYIPVDGRRGEPVADFARMFTPLDISALTPSLVESELFGHRKGAFTGAGEDRAGHLDAPEQWRTVFLDEIGDVDAGIQVKLLRVLQSREFHRLGDRVPRRFEGKIIAATNRDLAARIGEGAFRADLYYRLCSDTVATPSLEEQVDGSADELRNLVGVVAGRLVEEGERERVADEVFEWILGNLGLDYPWPGNMRELGQCVHNFVVRGEYRPLGPARPPGAPSAEGIGGDLTADEIVRRHCAMVYRRTGSYLEAARILGIDRRTVRARIGR
jgi:hypothetical protein